MPSVRASCCPLPLATPSGECVNHQSSVTLLCLDYKWGLFGIIKQIYHASVGNMMECFPSGGWFSLGLRPRENHPPSGKHSIMLPPLAWHICIVLFKFAYILLPLPSPSNLTLSKLENMFTSGICMQNNINLLIMKMSSLC